MHSLFEEQITREQAGALHAMEAHAESFAEARPYFLRPEEFSPGPERYLEQIRRIKEAVRLPVIGSLNGVTPGGGLEHARLIQEAGADALELNVYYLATDPGETGALVEFRVLDLVSAVKRAVTIPVAVKLLLFYSSLASFACELDERGADGLVLFNRFYQPDIEVESLEAVPSLRLSDAGDLLLRLRWLAILSGGCVRASLAVTGGVHAPVDAIKAVMAGADAVPIVSALLRNGPDHRRAVRQGMEAWLEDHEYGSLRQMRGSMALRACPDPAAFERANYMPVLLGWLGRPRTPASSRRSRWPGSSPR